MIDDRPDYGEASSMIANEVDNLILGISNPPMQKQVETIVEKINELDAFKRA